MDYMEKGVYISFYWAVNFESGTPKTVNPETISET